MFLKKTLREISAKKINSMSVDSVYILSKKNLHELTRNPNIYVINDEILNVIFDICFYKSVEIHRHIILGNNLFLKLNLQNITYILHTNHYDNKIKSEIIDKLSTAAIEILIEKYDYNGCGMTTKSLDRIRITYFEMMYKKITIDSNIIFSDPAKNIIMIRKKNVSDDINICSICFEKKLDAVYQCGHPFCNKCAKQMDTCPTCRCPVKHICPLFL